MAIPIPVPAQRSDVEAIVRCVRAAYQVYVERLGRQPAPMTADYAALIECSGTFVVRDPSADDVLAVVVLHPAPPALWIDNVAVHPRAQHRGLGRSLLSFAERHARAAGLSELRLYTNQAMTENIALYTSLGYEETDRRLDQGFLRVFFRKPL
jgi:ribosomal protein S18 acetylase RimI-like enzyme